MEAFVCVTCGTHYPHGQAPPDRCPVCDDERQYVGLDGQRWTTRAELAADRAHELREEEPGLLGVGVTPGIGIGQRSLVTEDGLMWDCVPLVDDATAERLQRVTAIAISHPHFYTGM